MEEVEHEQMEGALVVEDIESVTNGKMLEEKLRETVEKLRESEERLRTLYENTPDPLAVYVGREGHLLEYNKAFREQWLGYTDEELKEKIFLDFIHPDYHAMLIEEYGKKFSEEDFPLMYEIKCVNKKGEIRPFEISVGPYKKRGRVIGIEVLHRDITERKEMEKKLQEYAENLENMVEERTKELRESQEALGESEERLRTLYENIPDSLAVYVGREGHLLEYNRAFKKWVGYTDEELKTKNFLDTVHPDDRAMLIEEYGKEYSEKDFPLIYEIRAMNKKGEIRPIEISVGPYKKQGRIIGIEVIHRDITERKEMEKKLEEYAEHLEDMVEERTKELEERTKELEERTWALRKSEEMFRSIYNSSKDAIGFVSLDGMLLDVNDSFPKITGYSRDELLAGKKHQDMTPKKYHEYETKIIEEILATGKPAEYKKEFIRNNGSLVPVLVTAFVVKGDDGKPIGLATIIKDISLMNQARIYSRFG